MPFNLNHLILTISAFVFLFLILLYYLFNKNNNNLYKFLNKNSIFIGLKKGLLMDTLPPRVSAFINKPLIRILRVIGGICAIVAVLKYHTLLPYPVDFCVLYIGLLQMIQITVISIIKFFYILYLLIFRPQDFEVRY